jgi:hypothetical protein
VHHHRMRGVLDAGVVFEQAEEKVRIFAPSELEVLVETADRLNRALPREAIGGDEFGALQPRGIELIISRRVGDRHDETSPGRDHAVSHRFNTVGAPARRWDGIVIGEGDDIATRRRPNDVACRRRSMAAGISKISDHRAVLERVRGPRQHQMSGVALGPSSTMMISNLPWSNCCPASAARQRFRSCGRR